MALPPQFSVVIPTFNRADRVGRAVRSVLAQTNTDYELIVVDDASEDGSSAVLQSLERSHPNIRVHTNAVNLERSNSRNIGVQLAQGRYICFLDSDDYYEPDHLQVLADRLDGSNQPVLFTLTKFVDHRSGEEIWKSPTPEQLDDPRVLLAAPNLISTDAACIRRDVLVEHAFDPQLTSGEDTELFLRLSQRFPIEVCNRHTCTALTSPQSRAEHQRRIDSLRVPHTALRSPDLFSSRRRHRSLSDSYYALAAADVEAGRKAAAVRSSLLSVWHAPTRSARRSLVSLLLAVGGAARIRSVLRAVRHPERHFPSPGSQPLQTEAGQLGQESDPQRGRGFPRVVGSGGVTGSQ